MKHHSQTDWSNILSSITRKVLCILVLLFCSSLWGVSLYGQTIIELKKGGSVRAKTVDDYKEGENYLLRQHKDSLAYTDHLRRAFNALYCDSLREAEMLFSEALRLRPDAPGNHVVRYNLGLIDMARGEYKKASEKFTEIISDYPAYYDARTARAEAYLQTGRAAEAITDAEYVMSRPDESGIPEEMMLRARFVRGAARYRLRLYPEAHTDLEQIITRSPENINARILDALTLAEMGQKKEAINRLNLIVSAYPESTDALSTRATLEAELGQYGPARADYDRLIEMRPQESNYYIERARALIAIGEKTQAKRDLDKAVSLGVPRGVVHALYLLTK